METSEGTFNWSGKWNISFAGCGFRSVYYVGALSCILQRVPHLVYGASKIAGASSGCLVAAALTVGIPIEQLCFLILTTAKEARKHTLGVFHPTFSLLRTAQHYLLETLPEDAHLRANGKLCVSLTRISNGENVLVSEFTSREELIQVLMCSCFFPVYCGFIPPTYRGVRYMDGALSNNMPLFEHRNTITFAPFSGESDICPREGTFNFFEAHYGNVSIQVNTGNVHRVCTSFLPPSLENLAEICHNGYMDALSFLKETECSPLRASQVQCVTYEENKEIFQPQDWKMRKNGMDGQHSSPEDNPQWFNKEVMANLPQGIKKVFCETCRDSHKASCRRSHLTDVLPVKFLMYLLTLLFLPFKLILLSAKSTIIRLRGEIKTYGVTRTQKCQKR